MSTDIDTIYIGGEWVTPLSTNKIEIQSPAASQVDFPSWLSTLISHPSNAMPNPKGAS